MTITKETVARRIAAYLRHEMTLEQLVDWAENALMQAEFAEPEVATLSAVVARLGVADVRAFGLTWEDCQQLLAQLGFAARVEIVEV
jgi:cobyrinic acid a,c-diamide synthase